MVTARTRVLVGAQPLLAGLAVILGEYTAIPTDEIALLRPAAVTIVLAAVALLASSLMSRSLVWGALTSTAFVLFSLNHLVGATPLVAFTAWWVLIGILRARSGRTPPNPSVPLKVASASAVVILVFLVVTAVGAFQMQSEPGPAIDVPTYPAPAAEATADRPNIYLFLLDGYASSDSLQSTFGIANGDFERELAALGFDIADDARSNYNKTWLTLASMVNGTYVDRLIGDQVLPEDAAAQQRWLHALIERAALLDAFREGGYTIRAVPSAWTSTALTSADEYLDGGLLNDFEIRLISKSPWTLVFRDPVTSLLLGAQRDIVLHALEAPVELARVGGEPQLVLSHVHSPHRPNVLGTSELSGSSMPGCYPRRCSLWHVAIEELGIGLEEYRSGLEAELSALNDELVSAAEGIIAADPQAIIVFFSDHGSRYSLQDLDEHFEVFLAARVPRVGGGLFPDDESPVNILRRIASSYLGMPIEAMPYERWNSDWVFNLDLTRVEPGR